MPRWMKEYTAGSNMEFYNVRLPDSFRGLTFDVVGPSAD
jgi:hypothetical protein